MKTTTPNEPAIKVILSQLIESKIHKDTFREIYNLLHEKKMDASDNYTTKCDIQKAFTKEVLEEVLKLLPPIPQEEFTRADGKWYAFSKGLLADLQKQMGIPPSLYPDPDLPPKRRTAIETMYGMVKYPSYHLNLTAIYDDAYYPKTKQQKKLDLYWRNYQINKQSGATYPAAYWLARYKTTCNRPKYKQCRFRHVDFQETGMGLGCSPA